MAEPKKANIVIWDHAPELYTANDIFDPNIGENPARYLVHPGSVQSPGKHSPGQLRHARPYIVSGNIIFVFPVGVEGFSRTGQATLALHHYIAANAVDAQTIMREEGRISLSGTFPGGTAQDTMVDCENILRSKPNAPGLILYAPGVFEVEQYVTAENWEFTHDREDRTHSIDYTITLVRTGEGKKVKDPHGQPAKPNPTVTRKKNSTPAKTFTVRSGIQTFQQIAKAVYGSTSQWQRLISLNQPLINKSYPAAPIPQAWNLPTFRWPIGTKVKY